MAEVGKKFAKLGLAPPGDGVELDRVWSETVQNLIRQHRGAVSQASDPYAEKAMKADADQRAEHYAGLLDKVDAADVTAALDAIDHAETFPQHVAAVGAEPVAPGGDV